MNPSSDTDIHKMICLDRYAPREPTRWVGPSKVPSGRYGTTMIRVTLVTAVLAVIPTVAWAQTTTTTTAPTTTTTTEVPATTTTTTVSRVEDLVCSEPVNQVATCVDPQGRIVTRVDDFPRTTTTTVRTAQPAPPSGGAQLALTG